ncbi:MAG: transcriptional repressor LexA [Leptospirales bacterium]|nr:transcriptional repressor LexA [Leptospirales bacterium]
MRELTEKQNAILSFIQQYLQAQGYPPTIREIARKFEITAKGAYDHMKALEKKGYIKTEKNRSRAMEILKDADGNVPVQASDTANVPLLGRVAAGMPILAQENIEEYLSFPKSMVPDTSVFALRVAGESMKDAGILDGDIAVIQKCDSADNGEIVVALLDDEATLKYFFKDKKKVKLVPANDAFRPIVTDQVTIVGRLVGIYRSYGI